METTLFSSSSDLIHEKLVKRNPNCLQSWWRYLISKSHSPFNDRLVIYERALKALPDSYILWDAYLGEHLDLVRDVDDVTHPQYESLNDAFERSLVTMHHTPTIWLMYLETLTAQKQIARTRETFDRAFSALHVTQHGRIWEAYLEFVSREGVPLETKLSVYRRCLDQYDPVTHVEDFVEILLKSGRWTEAAENLATVLMGGEFESSKGKSVYSLWMDLLDVLVHRVDEVSGLDVDGIIRRGIGKFTDEVGVFWTSLADYYVKKKMVEKARDVYEEGMMKVVTLRDFNVIFDVYSRFDVAKKMDLDDDEEEEEELMKRRPVLANSVLLRQNPHDVEQWHHRVKLFEGEVEKQILTYTEALSTVDPMKAVGESPHTLWVAFAKLYEAHNDLVNARAVLEKAVLVNYKDVDHMACVWCEWAEMEVRHKNFKGALEMMRSATAAPWPEAPWIEPEQVHMELYKSLRLWSFYVDMEERVGTLESTKDAYERILELRIATPLIILNYAKLLEVNDYFEEAFKVYERGVNMFKYPHVKDIWVTYLTRFVEINGKTKVERARELFDNAVSMVNSSDETKRAMEIYREAMRKVADERKLEMYEMCIARAAELFGIEETREIFKEAVESSSGVSENDVKMMCIMFAEMERRVGEIDRARGIYRYASQFEDTQLVWEKWHELETEHGNEDTYRDMLNVKQTVSCSGLCPVKNSRSGSPFETLSTSPVKKMRTM
ncbi:hypothetical protein Bca52824_095091 [Brassica carinata]|uniref:Uncharacterized protein n=1 Tax=Brassica carinata TaxID=52824 RepID=A0A8X7TIC8_BRACI|nr:hypothetical protein Bca52824_095091 [Brassica carinata]